MGIFEAVRDACARPVWSRGGELARSGAVRGGDAGGPAEAVLRVVEPGRIVAPRVVLYPNDEEWECDCGSRDDPCVHVAAAAIAQRQGLIGEVEARLAYRFRREAGSLSFERVAKTNAGEQTFRGTLAGQARGAGAGGPPVTASELDFEVERLLGAQRAGRLPRGVLHKLVAALEAAADVQLDGAPIRPRAAPCEWRVIVTDDGPGFRLVLDRHPAVSEALGEDVVRCGEELRVLGASGLEGRELEPLVRGRRFAPEEAVELAAEVIPSLAKRLAVEVETRRLPEARSEPPRLAVETARDGDELSVLATLVYGDPPRARIDAGRLVPIQGALPLRDADAEQHLTAHLRTALGLEPGVRMKLAPGEALRFVARLEAFRGAVRGTAHQDYFVAGTLMPRFTGGRDDLALDFGTGEAPGDRVDAARAVAAWRAGESLVPLAGGGFAELPRRVARSARPARRRSPRRARGRGREAARSRRSPSSRASARRSARPTRPASRSYARWSSDFAGLPHAPAAGRPARRAPRLPADRRRLARASSREAGLGALLADDMGLGKTLQALCALPGRTLVVAPTSVLYNWWDECGRFRPALRRCLYHGPSRALDPEADVTLTSYALLRLEPSGSPRRTGTPSSSTRRRRSRTPTARRRARRSRCAPTCASRSRARRSRTASTSCGACSTSSTPGCSAAAATSRTRYARADRRGRRRRRAQRSARRIRPFVLRRMKSEVAPELPPRTELVLRVDLSTSPSARSTTPCARARSPRWSRSSRAGGSVLAALEALLRLRQAGCHPALLPGGKADGSAKVEALVERLETAVAEGHKALVFSQWTSLLDLVEPALADTGLPFTRLDGSTRDRAGVVARSTRRTGRRCS